MILFLAVRGNQLLFILGLFGIPDIYIFRKYLKMSIF